MCIRDRACRAQGADADPVRGAPVSYTHLDVYKRQGMDIDSAAGEIGIEQSAFEAGRGTAQELAGLLALGPDRDADIAALQGCLLYTSRCV